MKSQILPEINKQNGLEIGLYTIGDHIHSSKSKLTEKERLNQIVEMAKLSEQAGMDIFQLGESHQDHFVSQAHLTLLAAIAVQTKNIKLSTGATIIGVSDPIRVFEQAATIDLLSDERMELVCGRSARTGVFDLLGYSLSDYEELFEEKFNLLLEINKNETVDWEGEFRKPLNNAQVLPRPDRPSKGLPIWRANAGTLDSAIKAAKAGVPLQIMQLRGSIEKYKTIIDHYRTEAENNGFINLPVATAGFLLPKEATQSTINAYASHVNQGMELVQQSQFEMDEFTNVNDTNNVINIGSPEAIVEKILKQHENYHHDRYVAQIDFGGVTMDDIKEIIDIMGTKIIPEVKKYTKQ